MKLLKMSAFVFFLSCMLSTFSFSAGNPLLDDPNTLLKEKVTKMIDKTDLSKLLQQSTDATVEFIITNEQKIIVTKVNTQSTYLENTIKEKLNYKYVDIDGLKRNQPYRLKMTFVKQV